MSDLSFFEKMKFEKLFEMSSGYVMDFSNRTFTEFVAKSTGRDIYDARYDYASGSKANRLRAFWEKEPNYVVGKLLSDLLHYYQDIYSHRTPEYPEQDSLFVDCKEIATRLLQNTTVEAIESIVPEGTDRDFEVLARTVRDHIDNNQPEAGLDRLHTYLMKLIRTFAQRRNIIVDNNKPLHSIFGEYVRKLREEGLIESEMTERILKSTISTMEAFNRVRNERSFAHDNPILNYDESLLIFNHICSTVRFIRALEAKAEKDYSDDSLENGIDDEIPF